MRKETRKTLAYFYKQVWREKPLYFALMTGSILCLAALPFANIVLPKYIIEELMNQRRADVLIQLVLILAVLNWLVQSLAAVFTREINKLDSWFELFFEKQFALRSMTMDYELTEDPAVLDQGRKAMDGMGWYSGGLLGLTNCFSIVVSSAITLGGVILIIAAISPFLFVIALLAVIAASYVVGKVNQLEIISFNKGPKINRAFWYIMDVLCEPRYGKDIRLYGAEKMLTQKGKSTLHDLYLMFKELEDGKRKWGCVNALISMCESIGIYLYLGYLMFLGKVTVGDFMMLVNAALSFRTGLQNIITQLQELEKKADFMNEHRKYMEYKDSMIHGEKKVPALLQPEIVFQNVSFRYPRAKEYVLKAVNITIKPGEHLSVVGPNGAGKTTFIKLLCRLYDVTEGAILVNGVNIKEYQYDEYMKLLSVVFQDFKLFAMTLKENIRLGDWEKNPADMEELCRICGLKEKVGALPKGLDTSIYKRFDEDGIEPSGGEAQKIAITRAVFKDAPIIVLDEPTAALDPIAEYDIYIQFDQLVGGKTAVYISHRLSSCKFCDKIAVFTNHTIEEYGTHEELSRKENGIYAKMFEAQAQYYV